MAFLDNLKTMIKELRAPRDGQNKERVDGMAVRDAIAICASWDKYASHRKNVKCRLSATSRPNEGRQ